MRIQHLSIIRVFIGHRRSENSPFTTQISPANVCLFLYLDKKSLSEYSRVTLYLSPATRILNENQRAKKVVSDSPGLMDFAIGQVIFFEEFK